MSMLRAPDHSVLAGILSLVDVDRALWYEFLVDVPSLVCGEREQWYSMVVSSLLCVVVRN